MTQFETYKYLESIEKVNSILHNKCLEYDQLMTIATKTTQFNDGMPHASGKSDKVGNIGTELVELEREIQATTKLIMQFKREVVKTLEKLSTNHYKVLYQLYVKGLSYKEIAGNENKSRQWVNKTKNTAVQELSFIVKETETYTKIKELFF